MRGKPAWIALSLLVAGAAWAQQSASFDLGVHSINQGGTPLGASSPSSAGYRLSAAAIGDAAGAAGLSSASFSMNPGIVALVGPPGEVMQLMFTDAENLVWNPAKVAKFYNLYRDLVSNVMGLGYGNCEEQKITDETTEDSDIPPGGDGYFYLVTVENAIGEEGTKGNRSDTTNRAGNVCP